MKQEARHNPDISCDTVLETVEWQSLCATIHKNPIPPSKPPSLREAIRMIANLGGFLGCYIFIYLISLFLKQ